MTSKLPKNIITFDTELQTEILSWFGKTIDSEEFIIDTKSKRRVLTSDGEEITLNEFAGIGMDTNGREQYFKNDLPSLLKLLTEVAKNKEAI